MLTFMYITKDPALARIASDAGVQRIFVDWEVRGKYERQGHLDTVISGHSFEDARKVRRVIPGAELLIRINPFYEGTSREVEMALKAGANLIMLPMFQGLNEVEMLCEMVKGRAGIVPLIETPEALAVTSMLPQIIGIHELYVGLNDLHLSLNMSFMFEPLALGLVDTVADIARENGIRFGFGGVARVGEGLIPGEVVIGEHLRLASHSVILSRTFYRPDDFEHPNEDPVNVFVNEVEKLRKVEIEQNARTESMVKDDHEKFVLSVNSIKTLLNNR